MKIKKIHFLQIYINYINVENFEIGCYDPSTIKNNENHSFSRLAINLKKFIYIF